MKYIVYGFDVGGLLKLSFFFTETQDFKITSEWILKILIFTLAFPYQFI